MHPSVVRDRLIVAQQEIAKASAELAGLLGIDGLKPIPADARDEDERVMHRYESVLEFLKRALEAAGDFTSPVDVTEETEIDKLDLTPSAKTALYNAGILTLDRVREMSDEDLQVIPGVGPATIHTLREAAK